MKPKYSISLSLLFGCTRTSGLLLIAITLGIAGFSRELLASTRDSLSIKNVNVVDVMKGKIVRSQTVVIEGSVISFVGRSTPHEFPENSKTIDGSGKYLAPGLWDMHFHLCWAGDNDRLLYPILLRNGITGVRDMGGDAGVMRRFKAALASGEIEGPEIFGAGPMLDGDPPVYRDFSVALRSDTNIPTLLNGLRSNGVDFFKTYSLIREQQLKEIAEYCVKHDMTFAGHLSEYIEPETSISLGQRSVEHLNRLEEIWAADKSRIDRIGNAMASKGAFLCPTLITYKLKAAVRDHSIINDEYAKYIPQSLTKEWKEVWAKRIARHEKNGDWNSLDGKFESQKQLVRFLHKKGVILLAGSDFAGMPYVYPGIGLHQELELMAAAGLSNADVLRTATINPALYFSEAKIRGSVTVGKYADLLLLKKDPLRDIRALRELSVVISKGKVLEQ
ncbi:MAG: amidohydrolase family protein [Pyrinomonadaceae bacterium]|nr:amidohydrolase family protein [Pyrinomonadaceae bacterium]MBP9108602.1 amidohydrolase family protein [Pyrinomonadaceae bacterium]